MSKTPILLDLTQVRLQSLTNKTKIMQSITIMNAVESLRDLIYTEIMEKLLDIPDNKMEIDVCIGRYDFEIGAIESTYKYIFLEKESIFLAYDNDNEEPLVLLSIDEMLQLLNAL